MNVLICTTDNRLIRQWLQALEPIATVTAISNRSHLNAAIAEHQPKLVLFHMDGEYHRIDHAVALILSNSATPILVMDNTVSDNNGIVLLKAGVRGYAQATTDARLLQAAVAAIGRGEAWISRRLVRLLVDDLVDRNGYNAADNSRMSTLSEREREVAEIVAEGAANKAIAARLNVTERTIKAHLTAAFRKTQTRDRLELALLVKGQLADRELT